ncbi:MAG: adenylate/guanylate cyclase domain-containing protein [Rubrivivax sp.]
MDCIACGAPLSAQHSYCLECGTPATRNCPACAQRVSDSARFCPSCGRRLKALGRGPIVEIAAPALEARQTTVLVCDIVDSTALTNALDPEDACELLVSAQRCIEQAVRRHKGAADNAFDREEGDSQLFCFGLPHAHEDAAERAVAAALQAVADVGKLRVLPDVRVRIRIGVATGVVVFGHGPAGEPRRRPVIAGAAPNLAARLQAAAAPDTVVISAATRKLVGDLFDCAELGPLTLKGFEQPVLAWRVDRARGVLSRFEALHPSRSLSPLVGREREIGSLMDAWQLVREGDGQTIAIGGEPGIGKSRLLRVVLDRLRAEVASVLYLQCSPYHTNTAFHPVTQSLEHGLRLRRDAGVSAQRARVRAHPHPWCGLLGRRRASDCPFAGGGRGSGRRGPAQHPAAAQAGHDRGLVAPAAGADAQGALPGVVRRRALGRSQHTGTDQRTPRNRGAASGFSADHASAGV